MPQLLNKTILIISPQPWGKMRISKHHYAIELSKRNKIIFLNPPDIHQKEKFKTLPTEYENITQLSYKPFFNTSIRFHARWLYNVCMAVQIKKLNAFINETIDVVWCFELNLYSNLTLFGARKMIYHPVDVISYSYQVKPAFSADAIFSVSSTILDKLKTVNKPKLLVNHGLSKEFIPLASASIATESYSVPQKLKIGYIGNLLIHSIDLTLILKLVHHYPSLEFHFWGSYENDDHEKSNTIQINQLKESPNVTFHGLCLPEDIALQITGMDAFILTYTSTADNYDRSNSHKVLEYLSTGRVLISTPLSYYYKMNDLIQMSKNEDNADYIALFDETIRNLTQYNNINLQKKRAAFALENTYEKQLERIESFL